MHRGYANPSWGCGFQGAEGIEAEGGREGDDAENRRLGGGGGGGGGGVWGCTGRERRCCLGDGRRMRRDVPVERQ